MQDDRDDLGLSALTIDSVYDEKLKVIDLFAGSGGFSHALETHESNMFECVYANDVEQSAQLMFELNHPHVKFSLKDIHDVSPSEIPEHDILCAGFPCQPFSVAGRREGFSDERSNVFWKLIEIVKHHKPRFLLLENVKNLKTHQKGETFGIITSSLEKEGYHLSFEIFNTCKISSIPQNRERIYIVGTRDRKKNKEVVTKKNKEVVTKKNKEVVTKMNHLSRLDLPNLKIKSFLSNTENNYYYTDRYKVFQTIQSEVTKHVNDDAIYQYRRHYVRENKGNKCPTLTANMGGGGHNVPIIKDDLGIRKLTPRECFSLQGFDTSYGLPNISDSKLYKLAGNAISIPVVRALANVFIP